ncbi:MAG: isoprenylcysteine carboxylmethyltransferase family protein [Caldiserica bacterium]|nr:isoprenylcysteine carboxylmethyltransferase family protein [Caldisericota bacterium]
MHGEGVSSYAYNNWGTVLFSVAFFILFALGFLRPKKKVEWRSMGVFFSFLVVLFMEMYGFPLTIFLLVSLLGKNYPVLDPFSHASGHLILVFLGLAHSALAMVILHFITNGFIFFGLYLMYRGWKLIYQAGGEKLVKEGIYAHIRHPQYDGILLITIGFLIQWPSLTTLLMWPILIFAYYKLAMREERELEKQFGEEFLQYKKSVPAFIPRLRLEAGKDLSCPVKKE